jgi:basic membrane protein A and related proteins
MKKGRLDMKKYLALLLALVMSLSLFACGKKEGEDNKDKDKTEYKVAMITDYGDITDQSFNQTTYEACKAFAGHQNGLGEIAFARVIMGGRHS